jgi:hypothetical protein
LPDAALTEPAPAPGSKTPAAHETAADAGGAADADLTEPARGNEKSADSEPPAPNPAAPPGPPAKKHRAGFYADASAGNNWAVWSRVIRLNFTDMAANLRNGLMLGAAVDASLFFEGLSVGQNLSMGFALNTKGNMAAVADRDLLNIPAEGFAGGGARGSLRFYGGLYFELPVSFRFPVSLPADNSRPFGVTVRPAFFVPLLHAAPDSSIRIEASDSGGAINADITYNAVFYTPFGGDGGDFFSSLGMDVSLEAKYPLLNNLDINCYLRNIPLIPSTPRYRLAMTGTRHGEVDDFFGSLDGMAGLFDVPSIETGVNTSERVIRPFAFGFGASWEPFSFLTVNALLGMVFDGYGVPLEYQLSGEYRSPYLVGAALAHAYTDHLFREKLTLLFTLPALEISLGAGLRSQNFLKSFTPAGAELSMGLTTRF